MMKKSKKICRLIERFVNEDKKNSFEFFYGVNSKLKVNNIGYSEHKKMYYIDLKIILGEDTEYMEGFDLPIESFVSDASNYLLASNNIVLTISYDIE
jgi:histidinol phosphatase-like PHP family hydrolase